ncbi:MULTISPECIES: hypothetical protein [unclassified Streptomyces]|uniref:hypothetical protein n=1 Tax=unclassified Streptomyces TaxID=2593676 RepID=UPI002155FCC6|nr:MULTISPECIES: hypothetical protein [unclassified Streptomyces]
MDSDEGVVAGGPEPSSSCPETSGCGSGSGCASGCGSGSAGADQALLGCSGGIAKPGGVGGTPAPPDCPAGPSPAPAGGFS